MFGIGLGNLVRIGFRVSDHILKQQEIERARTASERARLQAEASREKAIEENARHRRTQLEDEIARASVAVECPNCGSTGNRIRKGSTGFCQFCGTAIQISASGIAYIADPIEKAKVLVAEDIKQKSGVKEND
jgi:RNA polymerase-binding transcription factor DksA